jgi:predicted O-methyltransferase YrrM
MSKASQAFHWLNDVAQVLFLDRFRPRFKSYSELASTACRSLKFHARSKIRPEPLDEIIASLSPQPVTQVTLPGPMTDLGDVGSQTYYHMLASLVRALHPQTILEFGTYLGVSAYTMALNAPPECKLYTVDLPEDASAQAVPELNEIDRRHIVKSRPRVGEAFRGTPQEKQIVSIREDSMTFRAETRVPKADLILVDGGHSLPVVTKDTENAFRVLAPHGVILWDDYFHLYPDVVRYLDGLSGKYNLRGIAGTNCVLYHHSGNA